MAVKLRLTRLGRKNRDFFRVVVVDSRVRRDGRCIEELGFFDPVAVSENQLKLDVERARYWLGVGAQPTETVVTLLNRAGIPVEPHKGGTKRKDRPKRKDAKAKK